MWSRSWLWLSVALARLLGVGLEAVRHGGLEAVRHGVGLEALVHGLCVGLAAVLHGDRLEAVLLGVGLDERQGGVTAACKRNQPCRRGVPR